MPFTPSHALVALPFVRARNVPTAAIAIGAMTPDLPLFLRGIGPSYAFTHSVQNVAWTTMIAAALFVLWRVVLRPASVELVPAVIATRLPGEWRMSGITALGEAAAPRSRPATPLGGIVVGVLALAGGVLSHIAWDQFTHEGRWGVELFPALDRQWGPLAGYTWLQHGSSLGGLLAIGIAAIVWLRARPVSSAGGRSRVASWGRLALYASLPVALGVGWLAGLAVYGPLDAEFTARHLAYRVLPPACAVWGLLVIALCIAIVATRPARARDTPGRIA